MSTSNFITLRDNGVQYGPFPKKQLKFLQKALHINETEHRTFCMYDFKPELKPDNFRQYIFKLRKYLEVEKDIYPKFYKIKGITLHVDRWMSRTDEVIGTNMLPILKSLEPKSVVIKEIKMEFDSVEELYHFVNKMHENSNELDQEIELRPIRGNDLDIIVKINPKSVSIHILGKDKPIVSCMNDLIKITETLGMITEWLLPFTCYPIPSCSNWLCTSYRLGMDGQYLYNDPKYHRTWKDMVGGFMWVFCKCSKVN